MTETTSRPASAGLLQPIASGILAAIAGFASSVAIVLAGFANVGASPAEAASGLFAITLGTALLSLVLGFVTRLPIAIAWSTPGAALLLSSTPPPGGYASVVGAYLVAAALMIVAGLVRPFGRAVAAIPVPLAAAMLAGVLFQICLAPVTAMAELPLATLPIVAAWVVMLRLNRLLAVPVALVVTAIVILVVTPLPPDLFASVLPQPVLIAPVFALDTVIGIGVPLFIVTMASQNIPGLAVLRANGYQIAPGRIFVATGATSAAAALLGGHVVNLAAITAALCAGPDAHPDPARRWVASVTAGFTYLVIALAAGLVTAFVLAAPPLLIQALAGIALFASLAGALNTALADEADRLPSIVTFLTVASGIGLFGIGAAFWGLVAGGVLMAALRAGRHP